MALFDNARRGLRRLFAAATGGPDQAIKGVPHKATLDMPIGPTFEGAESAHGCWPDAQVPSLSVSSIEKLLALENADVPTIDRTSDQAEALADQKQERVTSLSFPLHWTSAKLSWDYLFDFSVACELLGPRPDDLVLDFAAGTCWATELLCRVGVRTISVDLSLEMLVRGRERLDTDSRLVFRSDAGFVAGRGQCLPFRDGVFDGVLCLNALHHLPSYSTGLAEIYRVLKPGGRAVFSEPGSAHAREALSQFRMREEGIVEKSVSLPLVRHLAMLAGFTRMRVVPLRNSGAYAFDYQATASDNGVLAEMWADTLQLSPREHARFVLHKGDGPASDTLLPAHKLTGRLRADIAFDEVTATVRSTASFTDRLRIRNTGSVTWKARGRRFGGQVTCGLRVLDAEGRIVREDLGRTPLPHDVAPGETIAIDMTVAGGLEAGVYVLRYDMVVEGVTWFELHGSPCPSRPLQVT
jgi:SAM-dependent methyltransferase